MFKNFKIKIKKIKNLKLKIYLIPILTSLFMIPVHGFPVLLGPTALISSSQNMDLDQAGPPAPVLKLFLCRVLLGEIETSSLSSETYLALPGLTYNLEPNTPGAPTFTNPDNYYNKLHIIINNANNSSDVLFKIQVSSGSADFSSNTYLFSQITLWARIAIWQDYAHGEEKSVLT